jgi:hypothetical protein
MHSFRYITAQVLDHFMPIMCVLEEEGAKDMSPAAEVDKN